MSQLRAIASIAIAALGTGTLLALTFWLNPRGSNEISGYFAYQGCSLLVSGFVILAIWFIGGRKLELLRLGDLRAPANANRLLGIKATDNWRTVGLTFVVIISLATAAFLYFNFAHLFGATSFSSWMTALAVALPLSVINAFNEEIITRWSIAEGLGERYVRAAPWVSAVVFGSVHYFGVPGGLLGSVMAGFLGWFLTKSIQNTRGIGWAWVIHFVQDVLIFTVTIASLG